MIKALGTDGKQNWRTHWLQLIAYMSNIELQRECWLNPQTHPSPYWSFVELMCMYFDDLGLEAGYGDATRSGLVTEQEVAAAVDLHSKLSSYKAPGGNDYDHQAVLLDPDWTEITRAAFEAREALRRLPLPEADLQAIRGAA